MTPFILQYLCEPIIKAQLALHDARYDADGNIISGDLVTAAGPPLSP